MIRILGLLLVALPACDMVFLPSRTPDATPPDARTGYATAILADEPLAYWRLGVATRNTVRDETGNMNVGTLVGGVTPGAAGALVGDPDLATAFDGDDDVITAGDRFEFAGRVPFTLEAWVRPSVHANYRGVLSKSDEPDANGGSVVVGYHLFDHFDRFGCERSDGVAKHEVSVPAIALEAWSHVACSYDGTTLRLYVDGVEQASSTTNNLEIPPTTKPFAIGARNGGDWLYFDGRVDEVAVYDRALPAARIEAHRGIGLGL